MSIKLIVRDVVWVAIKGVIPDENGKPERFEFRLKCRRLVTDELKNLAQKYPLAAKNGKEEIESVDIAACMMDVAQDWDGVHDDMGNAVAFSASALERLFDTVGLAGIAFNAYLPLIQAKEKN